MKINYKNIVKSFVLSQLFLSSTIAQVDFNNYHTLLSKGEIPQDFTKETYNKVEDDLKVGRDELSKGQEKVFLKGINYSIDEILHSGLVVYGDEVTNYISSIADHLLKDDPSLRSKLRFYTLKSNSSNAFSTDQGIVFVTTGLISQLTSEAQLAFVLSHEIAHYTEKHVVETFDWKSKNNRNDDRIERLSQYSKDKEFEADKLGVKMYHDAGYTIDEIVPTFDVLMYSYLPFDEIEMPHSYFNSPYMYIPESLFPDKKFPIKAEEDYDDSRSSHPNIKKRKEAVEKEIGEFSNWGNAEQFLGQSLFQEVRNICRFESIRSDILNEQYADALYSIFLLEKEFPNSIYLKRMKAQVWLNMFIFKAENISSKTVSKTSDLEGESATIHYFLKKLSKNAASTLSLRIVYDIYKANPEDDEIKAVYTKLVKDLAYESRFKLEEYATKTFDEAAAEFQKSKDSSSLKTAEDTLSKKKSSKYDRIKSKKNINNAENFDSTKFYLYGISDIIKDTAQFVDLYAKYKKQADKEKADEEAFNALPRKERQAKRAEEYANKSHLGTTELIVVEPMVNYYKHGSLDYVKSEKLEKTFSEAIETSGKDVGMSSYMIDSRSLSTKGTQGYNERSILTSLLDQLAQEDGVNIFPVDYQLLKQIQGDYGTRYAMFSLVEYQYKPNISWSGSCMSIMFYPSIFVYFPIGFFTGNNTELSVLILDLETGTVKDGFSYYFKDAPKKYQLGAHMYDILNTFSQPSTTETVNE